MDGLIGDGLRADRFVMMAGHVMSGQKSTTHPLKYLLLNSASI